MKRVHRVWGVLALTAFILLSVAAGAASSESAEGSMVGLQRTALTLEQQSLADRIARPIGDVALFDVYIPEEEDGIALWVQEYRRGEAVSGGGRLISTAQHAWALSGAGDDGTYKGQISVWISEFMLDGRSYLRFALSLGDSSFSLDRELTGLDQSFRAFRSQPASLEMLKAGPVPLAVFGAYKKAEHSGSTSEAAKVFLTSNWQTSKEAVERRIAEHDCALVVYIELFGPDDWELRRALRPLPEPPAKSEE